MKTIGLLIFLLSAMGNASDNTQMTVYRGASCGCCKKWIKYMEGNGFKVKSEETSKLASIKEKYHVPKSGESCHTAVIGNYVIEGHVPADVVKRFLKEKPKNSLGLAVAGMPIGSPGMEGADAEPYDILSFDSEGKTSVYDHKN